jgi:hypothetical protein
MRTGLNQRSGVRLITIFPMSGEWFGLTKGIEVFIMMVATRSLNMWNASFVVLAQLYIGYYLSVSSHHKVSGVLVSVGSKLLVAKKLAFPSRRRALFMYKDGGCKWQENV